MFKKNRENILVIKTDSLAGFVAAEPLFQVIREAHPDSVISLLTTKSLERLARAAPYFDQIAPLPLLSERLSRQSLLAQIKRSRFQRIYDLSCDENSKRIQSGLGFGRPKWFSVDAPKARSVRRMGGIAVPDAGKFLDNLGIADPERRPDFSWALNSRKDSANMQPSWYGLNGPYGLILVNRDPVLRWPAERYGELCNAIGASGMTPVLIGDHDLHDFGDDISAIAPDLVDLSGKSDHLQLAALSANARFFVSDQADELYMALSMGCDGVIISAYDDPEVHRFGRHIVRIDTSMTHDVSAQQVWRTIVNMGLAVPHPGTPSTVQAQVHSQDSYQADIDGFGPDGVGLPNNNIG